MMLRGDFDIVRLSLNTKGSKNGPKEFLSALVIALNICRPMPSVVCEYLKELPKVYIWKADAGRIDRAWYGYCKAEPRSSSAIEGEGGKIKC